MRSGEAHAEVVGLHDQRHHAVDADGDQHGNDGQHHGLGDKIGRRDGGQRDGHDLRRQNEIGADGAGHLLVLQRLVALRQLGRHLHARRRMAGPGDHVVHLLVALEGEVEPAQHQQRGDGLRQEGAEQQRGGKQEQQLVLQRADGDAPDDGQLALCGEARDVARGHGRVVDDDAGRLGARLHRLRSRVIERCRRQLGQRHDVVQ